MQFYVDCAAYVIGYLVLAIGGLWAAAWLSWLLLEEAIRVLGWKKRVLVAVWEFERRAARKRGR